MHNLHIFQTCISPELMQVFANGKRRFHPFIEFYAIHLKNKKFDHSTTLIQTVLFFLCTVYEYLGKADLNNNIVIEIKNQNLGEQYL